LLTSHFRQWFLLSSLLIATAASAQRPSIVSSGEWRYYGSDAASTKYTPLDQINAANVSRLKVAWTWDSPDNALRKKNSDLPNGPNEATPLMANGVLYTSTGLGQVAALDAATGKTLWQYNPQANGGVSRGVAYWSKGDQARIFHCTATSYLLALDARTGKLIPSFGKNGRIDLTQGLRRSVNRRIVNQTSPPIVVGDVIVVGGAVDDFQDQKEVPPGDIRGFDAVSGKLLWTFHTIPQAGEPGNETWRKDSWKYTGAVNCWTLMTADPALGYVYIPLSTPNNDWYGGHRPGDGLYGESLVCLDAKTGRKVWHYQIVHHGLWDYDLPCAPVLADVMVNGKKVKAVAQVTKQAFCFVFDRVTGKPLWPIIEKPVPPTVMPGDEASPTQPFPTKPAPFDLQGATEENLNNLTPELNKEAKQILARFRHGELYTPPSTQPTIEMPGWLGGASWAGASLDPETGLLYVPSVNNPMFAQLKKPDSAGATLDYMLGKWADHIDGPQGLPLFKPPWGRITAIDLNSGEHRWMAVNGDGPRNHPALKGLNLPPLGVPRRAYLLVTKTLLLSIQEGSSFNTTPAKYPPVLRAFDKQTGKLLAEVPIPGHATGAPMTYMAGGRQYIVVPTGGNFQPAKMYALCLP
jgi:quinoprotein glucose dehydrogenase